MEEGRGKRITTRCFSSQSMGEAKRLLTEEGSQTNSKEGEACVYHSSRSANASDAVMQGKGD